MTETENMESIIEAYIKLFSVIIDNHSEKVRGQYFTRKFMPIHSMILTSANGTPMNTFDVGLLPNVNEKIEKYAVTVKFLYSYIDKKNVYEAIFTPK